MTRENNDQFEFEVALSFASEDRAVVEELANLMKANHRRVYFDEYEAVRPWDSDVIAHVAEIYRTKARYCLMFISQHYPLQKWTDVERASVQEHALRDADEYILLIRLDDTEVPCTGETTGYRDLRQHSMESIANLLEQKLIQVRGPSGPPSRSHDLRSGNVPSKRHQADDK